ncbi:UNVERIFIED_CONTAM: hypothetical protein NCL1_36916 [Trichonephila clavipes]
MEIRTGSSDSKSLCDESSSFESVQRRSNESQYGRKKRSVAKQRSVGDRHTSKTYKHRPLIISTPSSWSEASKKIKRSKKENIGYKRSREFGSGELERKIQKDLEHRVLKRALSSIYTNSLLPKYRKKDLT